MKRLYLTSEITYVANIIAKDIGKPKNKKLAFINTASEFKGKRKWVTENRDSWKKAGFNVFDYTITGKSVNDFDRDLKDVEVIHVNGGNSFYLLLQSKKSGFDDWIKIQVGKGKIYTGSSGGSSVAGPNIEVKLKKESRQFLKDLEDFDGYGLVDFIVMPHWGNENFRELYRGERFDISYNSKYKLIYLTDWQYV